VISFRLNGKQVNVDAPEEADLLYVLLNDLNMNGSKLGCGRSQCGACTVLIDGEPIRSCVTPTKAAADHDVTTLEGLMVEAHALLERNPNPTDADIRAALNGNLCRCGTHNRVVRAVLRAAIEA
jgi:aerobic-type carbon monoxide dehydrogenase small subunit (CoxS/CutS family)